MRHYIIRIIKDKRKLLFILLLLIIPFIDVVQILIDIENGASVPKPEFTTFLSLYTAGTGHILHKIMFWFLPLHLLIICSEDSLEDYDTGYKYALIERMGHKRYIKNKLWCSFKYAFLIIAISLLVNFLLVEILFQGGDYIKLIEPTEMEPKLYQISMKHPIITNFIYIGITALLSGMIAMIGSILAIVLHDRKIVYGITFLLWFIPVVMKNSVMLVIQPFMEYDFNIVVPTFLTIVVCYILIIVASTLLEIKNESL